MKSGQPQHEREEAAEADDPEDKYECRTLAEVRGETRTNWAELASGEGGWSGVEPNVKRTQS